MTKYEIGLNRLNETLVCRFSAGSSEQKVAGFKYMYAQYVGRPEYFK